MKVVTELSFYNNETYKTLQIYTRQFLESVLHASLFHDQDGTYKTKNNKKYILIYLL